MSAPGAWTTADPAEYQVDARLAAGLASYYGPRGGSIVDLGCGSGFYVRYLSGLGFPCAGYDANPNTPALSGGLCQVADLSRRVWLGVWDWALSLEVGEHIPPECEQAFIDNVHRCNRRGAVISWAIPGQTGVGHVNERSNEYIIDQFTRRGYRYDADQSAWLRIAASLPWFKRTIMVFERVEPCNTFTAVQIAEPSAA